MLHALVLTAAEGDAPNPLIPADYDIIWSLVCFVIILWVFWKLVLPKVTTMLDERTEVIEGGIKRAENAQAEAAVQLEKYNALLKEARSEAGKIREQARIDGTKILNELKESASAEAARITANAAAQIEAERQSALVSLRAEVGSLALDLAAGVIGQSLSDDEKAARLVDSFIADLEAADASAVQNEASK
ncbi:MAG: synthase subunit [Homoserinimonas sp.]|jgi:F-type H+-transporting ATPase subunit b|nr:synthase subunit [Homoserinimonas sp.]